MKLFFRIACLALLLAATLADDFGFDLSDALDDGDSKAATPKPAPKPTPKKDDGFGLDLGDALGDGGDPFAKPPPANPNPSGGGGGGTIKDSDLDFGGGNYQPDGGKYNPDDRYNPDDKYGGGGMDSNYNSGGDQPQEAGSGPMAGIISAIGVALVGAASSYFAYQKKKLCFKIQGGQDPEMGNRHMTQSDPQVMSSLMQKS